ncbi:MAG: hypothetical protein KY476_24445 [Planctomycetes bacterium]|nr:hypothetical protein [Planctomycetota bacterium]
MSRSSVQLTLGAGVCLGVLAIAGCSRHWAHREASIPTVFPLGSIVRAHYHTMQTNGEAADFIVHRNEFVGSTAELTPQGKDHIVEIAARMRSAPFPVLIERSEHNSDPELDAHRRRIVARILHDFGAPEADQRTIVSEAYGRGFNSIEAEFDYYRFLYSRGGFGTGAAGGFGGAGFGGVGTGAGFGGAVGF